MTKGKDKRRAWGDTDFMAGLDRVYFLSMRTELFPDNAGCQTDRGMIVAEIEGVGFNQDVSGKWPAATYTSLVMKCQGHLRMTKLPQSNAGAEFLIKAGVDVATASDQILHSAPD